MRFGLALIGLLLVTAPLSGCSSSPAPEPEPAEPALLGLPEIEAPVFGDSVLLGHAGDLYGFGGEPSVAAAPDGTLYVTGPMVPVEEEFLGRNGHGRVWRSDDGGASFTLTNREDGRLTDEGEGNGDTDIAVGAGGRVHMLDLGSDVPYRWTDDGGATWNWGGNLNEPGRPVDRQWIDSHGDFLAATWAAQDGDPRGITFTRSLDNGATWSQPRDIVDGMIQFGPVEIAPDGVTVVQPYVRDDDSSMHVLLSRDRGENWLDVPIGHELHRPSSTLQRPWSPTSIFTVAAIDGAGTIYLVWSEYLPDGSASLRFTRSADGLAWEPPAAILGDERTTIFPWIVAGDAGRVAIVYLLSDRAGDPNMGLHRWQVAATFLFFAENAVAGVPASVSNGIVHTGAVCPNGGACHPRPVPLYGDRSLLDLFEAALTPDGDLVVTWSQTDPVEGQNPQVRFARQIGGTRLLAAQPAGG